VQNERSWQLEAVLMLGAGLLVTLSMGMLATQALQHFQPGVGFAQRKFSTFVISNMSFQGAGLILTHFFLRRHEMTWVEFLGLRKPRLGHAIGFALLTAVLILPGAHLLSQICASLLQAIQKTPEIQPTIQVLQISVSLGQRIVFALAALVLAPIFEEILFRGILYRFIKQLGYPRVAVIGSSLFFGLIHWNLMTLVPLSFVAVVLALLYDKTDNLLAPIVTHSLFNTVNFVYFLVAGGP